MPPAYVNVGAYVGEGTMVDSHALVGSCAQVGQRVHLSAGAMLGGVLEPVGAMPVIVEDDVLVGGNCGVYEGAHGRPPRGAGLGRDPDRLGDRLRPAAQDHLPPHGGRAAAHPGRRGGGAGLAPRCADPFAEKHGLALYTPVIVKYRDEKTDAAAALEEALR